MILYISNNPNLGGTARILVSWLEQGLSIGTELGLIVSEHGRLADLAEQRGISTYVVGNGVFRQAGSWSLLSTAILIRLWLLRHRLVPQIIHCNDHDSYRLGATLRKLTGSAAVCHVRFIIARPFAEWAYGGSRCPDALLWTSEFQRQECETAVRNVVPIDRQSVIFLGIDPSQFVLSNSDRSATRAAWGAGDSDVVLGMACHFEPRKRLEDFIHLIHQLRSRGLPVRGVIAGKVTQSRFQDYERSLHELASSLDLKDAMRFLGRVDPVQRMYEAIDIFVSTSEMETFGNSICEAMAYRLPVVAYDGGSVPEVVGTSGVLVENRNLPELVSATQPLVVDASARKRLGELGYQRVVAEFLPDRQFKKLAAVYQSLLAGGRARQTVSRAMAASPEPFPEA